MTPARAPRPAAPPRISVELEPLEPRRLMAATVPSAEAVGDRIVLRGTSGADTIVVAEVLDNQGLEAVSYTVTIRDRVLAGSEAPPRYERIEQTFPAAGIRR